MDISCQFATSLQSPEHVAAAETLGYRRAWLFDTPAQSPDVWAMLALAAERTERIGLGPGVLVPGLRHPMVNASGAAMLAALAPGRVAVAFGTGFNGTRALGAPPATWSYLRSYVLAVRALLRGETVEWEGRRVRMLHPDGHAPARPIEIPVLISALGPRGLAVTREIADGLFSVNGQTGHAHEFSWAALGIHGTVLNERESLDSVRVRAAAGAGHALAYHAAHEFGGDVTQLPGGQEWLKVILARPKAERHLAVHDRHLIGLNEADEAAWAAGGWNAVAATTVTGSPAHIAGQLARYADLGVTEIVYQPAGPDIAGELQRFLDVARQLTSPLSGVTTMGKLQGKVAVITGGTAGIGLAAAKLFAAEGAYVFITGRRQKELDDAVKEIGDNVTGVQGDVASLADLDRLYETVAANGRIDILFANAGVGEFAPLEDVTEEHFDKTFGINVKGTLFTVQKALPLLNDGGSIILTGSVASAKGTPAFAVYGASKAAIRNFVRGWTVELKDRRIRSNVLSPGPIATPLAVAQPREAMEKLTSTIPMGRMGEPGEVAKAALFLASDDSSFVTGIELFVDGGRAQI